MEPGSNLSSNCGAQRGQEIEAKFVAIATKSRTARAAEPFNLPRLISPFSDSGFVGHGHSGSDRVRNAPTRQRAARRKWLFHEQVSRRRTRIEQQIECGKIGNKVAVELRVLRMLVGMPHDFDTCRRKLRDIKINPSRVA
jgi:hypothetical protein